MTIEYQNISTEEKECVLFGYNDYFSEKNFGNDKDVLILGFTKEQFNKGSFNINGIYFKSSTDKNLEQNLTATHVDILGKKYITKVKLNENRKISIDENTYINFKIAGSSRILIEF